MPRLEVWLDTLWRLGCSMPSARPAFAVTVQTSLFSYTQDVVDKIGRGVQAALRLNQSFLGVEQSEVEPADVRPECKIQVEIAEKLMEPDVAVHDRVLGSGGA